MNAENRATRINLLNFSSPPMRAFHMAWLAFFLCFFAWFGIAPLMTVVRDEMALSQSQVGWCIIASVAVTVLVRPFFGWLCDWIGPRRTYAALLILGSLPVMGIALAQSFATFLLFRMLIGVIGASFVITQYHTSVMFAPNCVGTANATTAGWGNLGGGVTQFVMPLVFALFVGFFGLSGWLGWRLSMVSAGTVCALMGVAYYFLTQDTANGDFRDLRARGEMPSRQTVNGTFLEACKDSRVWVLFVIYGGCFGMELTMNNIAALYFLDYFASFQSMQTVKAVSLAGLIAGLFGGMNIFARTLGGILGDKFGEKWGLGGRVKWLFLALFCEGLTLMLFSQMDILVLAIPSLMLLSLFVMMAEGATYSVVPFINKRAVGSVAGIVGAGGNAGAVAAGFLFKGALPWPTALFLLGMLVTCISFLAFCVRFSSEAETEARLAYEAAVPSRLEPAGATR